MSTTVYTAEQFSERRPTVVPDTAGNIVAQYAEVVVPDDLASGDILRLCRLPEDCVLVDLALHSDALDMHETAKTLALQAAIEDPALAAGAEDILAGSELTVAGNPTTIIKMSKFPSLLQNANAILSERAIVAKVTAAAATPAAGTVRMWISYRFMDCGK